MPIVIRQSIHHVTTHINLGAIYNLTELFWTFWRASKTSKKWLGESNLTCPPSQLASMPITRARCGYRPFQHEFPVARSVELGELGGDVRRDRRLPIFGHLVRFSDTERSVEAATYLFFVFIFNCCIYCMIAHHEGKRGGRRPFGVERNDRSVTRKTSKNGKRVLDLHRDLSCTRVRIGKRKYDHRERHESFSFACATRTRHADTRASTSVVGSTCKAARRRLAGPPPTPNPLYIYLRTIYTR